MFISVDRNPELSLGEEDNHLNERLLHVHLHQEKWEKEIEQMAKERNRDGRNLWITYQQYLILSSVIHLDSASTVGAAGVAYSMGMKPLLPRENIYDIRTNQAALSVCSVLEGFFVQFVWISVNADIRILARTKRLPK